MKNGTSITALICTLNEESALSVSSALNQIPEIIDEVLVVDGHSEDDTVKLVKEARPDARILYQPGKGKGNALRHGFRHATGDIIVTLDADGSTDPREVPKFVDAILSGYTLAKGSRFLKNRPVMPPHRRFGNWVLTTTTNILFGTNYTDVCSGYNAFWSTEIDKIGLTKDGFEMEQQMNARAKRAGLKVIEVGVRDEGRLGGESKTRDVRQGLTDLLTIIVERFRS